jgi:hypothetical protein
LGFFRVRGCPRPNGYINSQCFTAFPELKEEYYGTSSKANLAVGDYEEVFKAYRAVEVPSHAKTGEYNPKRDDKPERHWGACTDSAEEKRGGSSAPVPRTTQTTSVQRGVSQVIF